MTERTDELHRPSGSGTPSKAGGWRHVPALDGLRGLAVIGVIAFHAQALLGGYLGVDLFFVLSGYLITSLLLVEHRRTATLDLAAFWTRRARRLLPAVVVLVVVAAIVMLGQRAAVRAQFGPDAAAALLYVANWRAIVSDHGYWAQFVTPSPLEHLWSLAIEEQFYLVWPLVTMAVLGTRRRGRRADGRRDARHLLVVSVVGATASTLLMGVWSLRGFEINRLYLGTDTRAAGVLLGATLACLLALADRPPSDRQRRVLGVVGWVGVAVLVAAWGFLDGRSPVLYRGGFLACGLAAIAVIASVVRVGDGVLARILAWRPLCGIGLISYGLYLWHWPIFVWLDEARVPWPRWPLLALQLTVTLAVALVSYRFVEMPIRRGRLAGRTATLAVGSIAGAFLIVAFASSPSPPAVDAATAAEEITPLGTLAPPVATELSDPPRVLIVGDSVADSLAEGIVPHAAQLGADIRNASIVGCGLARSNPMIRWSDGSEADDHTCFQYPEAWKAAIDESDPDIVIMVIGWPGGTDRFIADEWRRPCDPTFDAWYTGEVDSALDVAGQSGAKVFLATTPYARPPTPPSDPQTDCLNRIYRAEASRGDRATIVDLAAWMCPGGDCQASRDGVDLRPDGIHFEDASGVWVGTWLLDETWSMLDASAPPAS